MWTSLVNGISGFLTSIYSLIASTFNGVVSIFYVAGTGEGSGPTVLLEAIAFAAAASLVGVAIYVIVRLIKGALARTRNAANVQ